MRLAVLFFCTPALALAQEPDITNLQVFRESVNIVIAPTTVTNRDGSLASGLKPHQFKLYDNNKEQDVKVDIAYQPISLVVAIQCDGSMTDVLPKLKGLGSILESQVLGEKGQVAIIAFDHRIRVVQGWTSDSKPINEAIAKLKPGSSSHSMVDAVTEAARMLNHRPQDSRRVVLLIGETQDRGSEGRVREALTALQFANVSYYALNVNRLVKALNAKSPAPRPDPIPSTARHGPNGSMLDPTSVAQYTGWNNGNVVPVFVEIFKQVKAIFIDNPTEVFSRYTGGKEYSFITQTALQSAVLDIGEELHTQYLLSYNPNNKLEGGFHEIRVEVDRMGLNVRTRPGYWMAGKPE
jgi:VWFA-related protein